MCCARLHQLNSWLSHTLRESNAVFNLKLQEILLEYSNCLRCYTDGLETRCRAAACTFSIEERIFLLKVRKSFTISSAEITAIFLCFQHFARNSHTNRNILIVLHSLSSLQTLRNLLAQCISLILNSFSKDYYNIAFLWVSSHFVGREGKKVLMRPKITTSIHSPPNDLEQYYQKSIMTLWISSALHHRPQTETIQSWTYPLVFVSARSPLRVDWPNPFQNKSHQTHSFLPHLWSRLPCSWSPVHLPLTT